MWSTAYVHHEAASCFLEDVLGHKFSAGASQDEVKLHSRVQVIFKMLMEFSTDDALLLSRQLAGLTSCAKCAFFRQGSFFPSILGPPLQLCFSKITYRGAKEEGLEYDAMHADTRSTRRRAIASLVKIASTVPALMLTEFPNLCGAVNELLVSGGISDGEAAMLFEMLVEVSNSMSSFEKQRDFLRDVLARRLAQWQSPSMTAAVSSSSSPCGGNASCPK